MNMDSLLFIIFILAVIYLVSVVWHAGGEKAAPKTCVENQEKMYFSVLEKHEDGSWWWHPWLNRQPYSTPQEAEECFQRMFELLPEIKNNEYYSTPELKRGLSSYWIDYPLINIEAALSADNAVDAAFKSLVWCIEHGYIKTNKSEKKEICYE